jgi:hypothetical protein
MEIKKRKKRMSVKTRLQIFFLTWMSGIETVVTRVCAVTRIILFRKKEEDASNVWAALGNVLLNEN